MTFKNRLLEAFIAVVLVSAAAAQASAAVIDDGNHGKASTCQQQQGEDSHGESSCPATATTKNDDEDDEEDRRRLRLLLQSEVDRCGGAIVDPHLHTAPWFDDGATLRDALLEAGIGVGLLYNPYPNLTLPYDVNERVTSIAASSGGHVYALASLNTTHPGDWKLHRKAEMERLAAYLQHPLVLGAKLAPPHTCLKLRGERLDDVVRVVSESSSNNKVLAIHIGTTPFCGPLGARLGIAACCQREYVDPRLLLPYIRQHPEITFALLHAGHEFLPPDSPFYYNFEFVDASIELAQKYPNVYLSLSAMFAREPATGELRYPGGAANVVQFQQRGVISKLFWGSDASWRRADIRTALLDAIQAMVEAGYTERERTWVLCQCARQVFQIPNGTTTTTTTTTETTATTTD